MKLLRKMGKQKRTGIGILIIIAIIITLLGRFLISVFPINFSVPQLSPQNQLDDNELLAFAYMRPDILRPFEIYIIDSPHHLRSISQGIRKIDLQPVWSPGGNQLVYQSISGNISSYILVDVESMNRQVIASDDMNKRSVQWSPNGLLLAYLATELQTNDSSLLSSQLRIIDITTGNSTSFSSGTIQDFIWLADSLSITAIIEKNDEFSIDLLQVNGDQVSLFPEVDYLKEAGFISISPDASKVAYLKTGMNSDTELSNDQLFISDLDGEKTHLIGNFWLEGSIVWSPDSTRLAFVALSDTYEYALIVVNVSDKDIRELMLINTADESGEIMPADPVWSPNGTHIAISSISDNKGPSLFIMNADGTDPRKVISANRSGGMIYDIAWMQEK